MRSGWFWGTDMWEAYQREYYAGRERPVVYKSSPLADDHDFHEVDLTNWKEEQHQTQVIDLRTHQWSDVRKSYRGEINKIRRDYQAQLCTTRLFTAYMQVHIQENGIVRPFNSFQRQWEWMEQGYGLLVGAHCFEPFAAFTYWIVYNGAAYRMSSPSLEDDLQKLIVWESLAFLRARDVQFVEIGRIDGSTDKEKAIGIFNHGFGGETMSYTEVRRCS